tara:strand:+ start:2940 stop:3362 length:423 start_codon:yes stop_codon:yes gene_type:complete
MSPLKKGFRKNLVKRTKNLCEPAMLYLIISVMGMIIMMVQNTKSDKLCIGSYQCNKVNKMSAFIFQVLYVAFWTWFLNLLCRNGYVNISWIIVLFPFLVELITLVGLTSSGVFVVKEGMGTCEDGGSPDPSTGLCPEDED